MVRDGDALPRAAEGSGGAMTAQAAAATRRLFVLSRIDYAVLFLVVAAMTLKPSVEDGLTLAGMGTVLVATGALVARDLSD